jgi:hypothetical protein
MSSRVNRFTLAWNDVRYYVRYHPGRPWALVTALWRVIIRGHDGELCEECGLNYVLWHAPDDLYTEVVGCAGGLLCPACFDRIADDQGIVLEWVPTVFLRRGARG